jgi:hypothetical protein
MRLTLETLKPYNKAITRIGDDLHDQGYAEIADTVIGGAFQEFDPITQGFSSYLIDGEAEFFPKVEIWKTKGLHLAYNPDFFQVLDQEEYSKKEAKEKIDGVIIYSNALVRKSIHGNPGIEEEVTDVFLVPTGKEKYKAEDLEDIISLKLRYPR